MYEKVNSIKSGIANSRRFLFGRRTYSEAVKIKNAKTMQQMALGGENSTEARGSLEIKVSRFSTAKRTALGRMAANCAKGGTMKETSVVMKPSITTAENAGTAIRLESSEYGVNEE